MSLIIGLLYVSSLKSESTGRFIHTSISKKKTNELSHHVYGIDKRETLLMEIDAIIVKKNLQDDKKKK